MTEQAEVKIVGNATSAITAFERVKSAVASSVAAMRDKLDDLKGTSRAAFDEMGDAAKKGANRVESAARETSAATSRMRTAAGGASTAFKGMGVAALAVGATIVGLGLGSLARDLYDVAKAGLEYAGSLGETAQSLGITTRFMQEFRYAATQNGASVSGADNALGKFSITLGKAFDGAKPAIAAFTSLGINMLELERASDSRRFELVADAIARISDPARQSAAAVAIFGRGAREIIPTLQQGAEGFRLQAEEARKYGLVLSDDQIQKADKTADKIDQLTQALQAKIAGVVADNADKIGDLANSLANLADKAIKAAAAYSNWLRISNINAGGSGAKEDKAALMSTHAGRVQAYDELLRRQAAGGAAPVKGVWSSLFSITNPAERAANLKSIEGQKRAIEQAEFAARRLAKAQEGVSTKPPKPDAPETPPPSTKTGGGKGTGKGSSTPAAAKGPSLVDGFRDELNDLLDAEKNWGVDEAAFTAEFWAKKLATTKASVADQKEIEREVARARLAANKDEVREQQAVIQALAEMRQTAALGEIDDARTALNGRFALIDQEEQRGMVGNATAVRRRADLNRQLNQLDIQEANQSFQIKIDALRDETKINGLEVRAKRELLRQIALLESQHETTKRVRENQAKLREKADEAAVLQAKRQQFAGIASAWGQALGRMATLQAGFGTTFKSMWGSLVGLFQQAIARMIELWIVSLLTKEATSKAFNAKQILMDAKAAAAGAWRAVVGIPVVGPILAPIAAAAAFAGVMAFSAQDGYDVPGIGGPGIDGRGGQVGIVHPREMILPAEIADRFRSGGGGGDTHHWNVVAMDGPSFGRFLMDNKGHVAKAASKAVRDGYRG